MKLITETISRGDRWSYAFIAPPIATGFDWSGVVATCNLREKRDPASPVIFAFAPLLTPKPDGSLSILLDLPGHVTATAPKVCCADLRLSRQSPLFGPYVVAKFELQILPTT